MSSDNHIARVVDSIGGRRIYQSDSGEVEERVGGSISWRNNNPGNLKFEFYNSADKTVQSQRTRGKALSDARDRFDGVVDLDQFGNAIFESYEAGRSAKIKLLTSKYADDTVGEMLTSYSRADYSGQTRHQEQLRMILGVADQNGVDLRGKKIGEMNASELSSLADGIAKFEGWREGSVRSLGRASDIQAANPPSFSIYNEAKIHFFNSGERYEYGRPDIPKAGRDQSRLERDSDRDGKLGVDCSAFVWRGLKNAGFDVPGDSASGFTTYTLFNGGSPTEFARQNFDVISADDARKQNGKLKPGDIIMFAGDWQHVGIFKGYDEKGQLHFIGSQATRGAEEVTISQNGYWDGRELRIVGALRAKPEFQVNQPLHNDTISVDPLAAMQASLSRTRALFGSQEDLRATGGMPDYLLPNRSKTTSKSAAEAADAPRPAFADGKFNLGDEGVGVELLQHRLNRLGYTGRDGDALDTDGKFGPSTRHAVRELQQEHGLRATGEADMATLRKVEELIGQRWVRPVETEEVASPLRVAHASAAGNRPVEAAAPVQQESREATAATSVSPTPANAPTQDMRESAHLHASLARDSEAPTLRGTYAPALSQNDAEVGNQAVATPVLSSGAGGGREKVEQEEGSEQVPTQAPRQAPPQLPDQGHAAHLLWMQTQSAMSRATIPGLENLDMHTRERLVAGTVAQSLSSSGWNLRAVDHVVPSTHTNPATGLPQTLFAVQGDPESPAAKRVPIDVSQAMGTSIEQSSQVAHAVMAARDIAQMQELLQAQQLGEDRLGGPTMKIGGLRLVMPSAQQEPDGPKGGGDGGGGGGGGGGG